MEWRGGEKEKRKEEEQNEGKCEKTSPPNKFLVTALLTTCALAFAGEDLVSEPTCEVEKAESGDELAV